MAELFEKKKYVLLGITAERLVPILVEQLNQPVVVYGTAPWCLVPPYLVENPATAVIEPGTTVVCTTFRLPEEILQNSEIATIFLTDSLRLVENIQDYDMLLVRPGDLPDVESRDIYMAAFSRKMSYENFQRFFRDFPRGVLGVCLRTGEITEYRN